MNSRPLIRIVLASALVGLTASAPAQKPERNPGPLAKTATVRDFQPMLINNVLSYYTNDGSGAYNPASSSNEGFEYPKGGEAFAVFVEGVLWGCMQKGELKVGGSAYQSSMQPGRILSSGTSSTPPVGDDPANPANRCYRVRRDIRPLPGVMTPLDSRAAGELHTIFSSEVSLMSRYTPMTAAEILQRYWDDWNGWPADQGAPYEDVDQNGRYDPLTDIPGQPGADQTIWYVVNDLDSTRSRTLAGSLPIGIEMQKTVWAYAGRGSLENIIFTRTRLMNKSGTPLDSMYVSLFVDCDLGDAGDDLVGCDTFLNLGYVYSYSDPEPQFGPNPPSVGYALLQGPVVAGTAGDTARFGGGFRPGFRNLPMTAFEAFTSGYTQFADPNQGAGGDVHWYRLMRGLGARTGVQFQDPTTRKGTSFCFSGDPVLSTNNEAGWVDGTAGYFPSDRRFTFPTGPFTMAPGDTQEVVIAAVGGRAAGRLKSITALKSVTEAIQTAYRNLFEKFAPRASATVHPEGNNSRVTFAVDVRGLGIRSLYLYLGTYDERTVSRVPLSDDGTHGDTLAGDGIFGGEFVLSPMASGFHADAWITYDNGVELTWPYAIENISTVPVTISSANVVSDNLNSDGVPNPGENVRYSLSLVNSSALTLGPVQVLPNYFSRRGVLGISALASSAVTTTLYNPLDSRSYLEFDVPPSYLDTTLTLSVTTGDPSFNMWRDTLVFPVRPLSSRRYFTPLVHGSGRADGNFEIAIVDSSKVKNHLYVIRGIDMTGSGYSVKDSTTGAVLIAQQPLPDTLGHTSPVVDGFKVLLGTVNARAGMKSWRIPSGTRRFSPVGGFTEVDLEGFSSSTDTLRYDQTSGTIGMGGHFAFGGIGTSLAPAECHTVLLKLAAVNNVALWDPKAAPTDENVSLGYRYLRASTSAAADPSFAPWIINTAVGYPYQDYNYSVPFSAWDLDVDPPARLAVGMFENNVTGGKVDGRYWPGNASLPDDNTTIREFAFIFRSPYTMTADPSLAVNLSNNASTPLMWVMTCNRRAEVPWAAGDRFQINAYHPISAADMWTFNPTVVVSVPSLNEPTGFALNQNYPNPFNPTTVVSWQLSVVSNVQLRVYDVLGREVATLVKARVEVGAHSVTFNARNIASGVYFYRLEATGGGKSYVATKKMMVIK